MITTVVTVTSTFLAGSFGAAAVAALILFLIMRELTSAHAEESGSMRSKVLSHAPRADQPAPRRFRLHRRGEGPRSLVRRAGSASCQTRAFRTIQHLLRRALSRAGRRAPRSGPRARFGRRLREPPQGRDEPRLESMAALELFQGVEDLQPGRIAAQPGPGCQHDPRNLLDRRPEETFDGPVCGAASWFAPRVFMGSLGRACRLPDSGGVPRR